MAYSRIKGFVVGIRDPNENKKVWKIRINQRGHPNDGKKFVVASTHNEIELAGGLDVTFYIGNFGPGGKDQKAVDVMLASTQE